MNGVNCRFPFGKCLFLHQNPPTSPIAVVFVTLLLHFPLCHHGEMC
jgi:hypothetical protein